MPAAGSNLVSVLRARTASDPDRVVIVFLPDGEIEGQRLTYRALDERARATASVLAARGLRPGDRALLLDSPAPEFLASFFGCLYAGVLAVPLGLPTRTEQALARLAPILDSAKPAIVLGGSGLRRRATAELLTALALLPWPREDELTAGSVDDWKEPSLADDALAFLQYTSGSTSAPRGVMVSHRNLLHNSSIQRRALGYSAATVAASWLPLFHDMGLIMGALQPIVWGFRGYLMPAAAFLKRPVRWLAAVTRYRVTHSYAPDFGYALCADRIGLDERTALDLSSWRVALNGAEPVRASTLARFEAAFVPCGFVPNAWTPGYGLAEATLAVAMHEPGAGVVPLVLDAHALGRHRAVVSAHGEGPRAIGVGRPDPEWDVRIVRDDGSLAEEAEVGEIWLAGPSVAAGYWHEAEATRQMFQASLDGHAGFLRTGDLGFLRAGVLYITGRAKDLVIIRGQNHYPQDIELTVEHSDPAIRSGCVAAFSVDDGEERLIVVAEIAEPPNTSGVDALAEIVGGIAEAVTERHELRVHDIVLLRPGTIFKTSSGKIQRAACRAAYLDGSLRAFEERR